MKNHKAACELAD